MIADTNMTKKYLETKRTIDANFRGLKNARDLPNDHMYGVKSGDFEHNDMEGIVKNNYLESGGDFEG